MTLFTAGDQMDEYERLDTPPADTKAVAWRSRHLSWQDTAPWALWTICPEHQAASAAYTVQPLYTHPPQPDALPGDMREKVAQCFDARRLVYEDMKNAHDPLDDDTVTAWEKYDFACEAIDHAKDAILSLIQSERGGA